MKCENLNFTVSTLGKASLDSPIALSNVDDDFIANYVTDDECILYDIEINRDTSQLNIDANCLIERAGPRKKIYFDPTKTRAAIVTCGGLCPGLNDVIRSIVMSLWYQYGVQRITGIKFGYRGFLSEFKLPCIDLDPKTVQLIHHHGGTLLGSSRGYGDRIEEIVDSLERMNINMLFTIGGDGTQ